MDGVPDELFDAWTAAVQREGERLGVLAQALDAGRTPATGGLQPPVPWGPGPTARDRARRQAREQVSGRGWGTMDAVHQAESAPSSTQQGAR